jgi:hypothetical protein
MSGFRFGGRRIFREGSSSTKSSVVISNPDELRQSVARDSMLGQCCVIAR